MREKKPPALMPLMIVNTISGANVVEIGQRAIKLAPFRKSDIASVLRGPILSLKNPAPILPMADEKLNDATSAAAMLVDRPIDELYSGRKNGGTSSGKVAKATAKKSMTN